MGDAIIFSFRQNVRLTYALCLMYVAFRLHSVNMGGFAGCVILFAAKEVKTANHLYYQNGIGRLIDLHW